MVKSLLPAMQGMQARPLGQEDSLEKDAVTHSRLMPGESHEQRSLAGSNAATRVGQDSAAGATTVLCAEAGTGTAPLCSNKHLIPSIPAISKGSVCTHIHFWRSLSK